MHPGVTPVAALGQWPLGAVFEEMDGWKCPDDKSGVWRCGTTPRGPWGPLAGDRPNTGRLQYCCLLAARVRGVSQGRLHLHGGRTSLRGLFGEEETSVKVIAEMLVLAPEEKSVGDCVQGEQGWDVECVVCPASGV